MTAAAEAARKVRRPIWLEVLFVVIMFPHRKSACSMLWTPASIILTFWLCRIPYLSHFSEELFRRPSAVAVRLHGGNKAP